MIAVHDGDARSKVVNPFEALRSFTRRRILWMAGT